MAQYYVRKTGSDENDGLTPAAAFLTIDKAANTAAAGDSVYIGSGVYRELVTMDTSGTSGSVISFIGDVTGAYTGDAGLVTISAHDSPYEACSRVYALDLNYAQFLTFQNITFEGGTTAAVGHTDGTTDCGYEAVTFQTCVLVSGEAAASRAVYLELNDGATPAGDNGLRFLNCVFVGEARFDHHPQETANINLKMLFENCTIKGRAAGAVNGIYLYGGVAATYSVGGVTVRGCLFDGCYRGLYGRYLRNTANTFKAERCVFISCYYKAAESLCTDNAMECDGCISWPVAANSGDVLDSTTSWPGVSFPHMGGISDLAWWANMGWSPYKPFEPIAPSPVFGQGAGTATTDLYGDPRPQRGAVSYYFFNASDAAASDPNAKWVSDTSAFSGSVASAANTGTEGSTAANFLMAEGTSAPPSGGTIGQVRARLYGYGTGTATVSATVYTDALGEALGTITNDLASAGWDDWAALTAPTGGWTWAALQALEVKVYRNAGTGTVYVYCVQLEVTASVSDLGPVEARNRPAQESTTVRTGTYALRFDGAGWHDLFVPVNAEETTISVYARKDSNYTGDAPLLEVYNIPGVADQSDAMAGAADTWEELSCTFTPTAAGMVRVRLRSRDTSATGEAFFDDLART